MFKIILIEPGQDSKSPLLLETMKEKHGADIILMNPNEAKENNVKPEDIFIQFTPYIIEDAAKSVRVDENPLSGQQRRRQRRQQERKNKKKK